MALASTQKKLTRVRPPRVQITYDIHVGDAVETKELPFLAGIMADLSGTPDKDKPLPKLKDRNFTEIDRDNFNKVMGAIGPRVVVQVDNKLKKDDESSLNLELKFKNMDDFNPVNIVNQVEPLRKLYEARERLSDLLTKLDGNEELDELLQDVVRNTQGMENIRKSYKQPAEEDK